MDVPKNKLVAKNLDLMCDLELVFGLPCILPMLEVVHKLIKYTQRWDIFICDFLDTVRSLESNIYWFYVNLSISTRILLSLSSLLFTNIILNNCPHLGYTWKWSKFLLLAIFGIWYWWLEVRASSLWRCWRKLPMWTQSLACGWKSNLLPF